MASNPNNCALSCISYFSQAHHEANNYNNTEPSCFISCLHWRDRTIEDGANGGYIMPYYIFRSLATILPLLLLLMVSTGVERITVGNISAY
jgi:hypothetical protein